MEECTTMEFSSRHINFIVFLILGLYPLVGMGIDLIAPSLPAIGHDMQISSTISKNMISIYLFGYAIGNFLIGFLSDTLGRRKIIIYSFLVFSVTSILPTLFPNTMMLLMARFIQGSSIAAYAVVARAIFSDILPINRLKQSATMLATAWGIGPVIGPIIGGYLQYYFGWQACFYFFAIFSFIGFIAMLIVMPETHTNYQPFNPKIICNNLVTIIKDRGFISVGLFMGAAYSMLIVFNTLGPFFIQSVLGYSPLHFGHLALWMGAAFLCSTFISRYLIKKYQPEEVWLKVLPIFTIIAVGGVIASYIWPSSIWAITVPSFFMFLCSGIIYPAAMAKGLTLFRHLAGSSAAIMSLINILTTSIVGFLASLINPTSAIPITWIYLVLISINCLSYLSLTRSKRRGNAKI